MAYSVYNWQFNILGYETWSENYLTSYNHWIISQPGSHYFHNHWRGSKFIKTDFKLLVMKYILKLCMNSSCGQIFTTNKIQI